MLEKEYAINRFKEKYNTLEDGGLAFYVDGEEVWNLVDEIPQDWKIGYFVNDGLAGRYIKGFYVATFAQMLDLGVKHLVLAVSAKKMEQYYREISVLCRANGIKLYDMYGNDMYRLHESVVKKQAEYPTLWERSIQYAINEHEAISFKLENVLFLSCLLKGEDLFAEFEKKTEKQDIRIPNLETRLLTLKEEKPRECLKDLIKCLMEEDERTEEEIEAFWEMLLPILKRNFRPRRAVAEALEYAVSAQKTVFLISDDEDCHLGGGEWSFLLNAYGIKGYKTVVTSMETKKGKYEGLFRECADLCENASWLHVGDEEADLYLPQIYGMDTFLVKSPYELYLRLDPIASQPLEHRNIRSLFETYIMKVYGDEYLMYRAEQNRLGAEQEALKLQNKARFYLDSEETVSFTPVLFDDIEIQDDVEGYERISFAVSKDPRVSIVIPVYDQFCYTYNCLRAIHAHSGDVEYEVIVADDGSTDQVRELDKIVSGITVLHNEKNLKFLLNCNRAAEYAKGEFLVFLNNDTQVQPGWLEPLVKLMDEDERIGMTGAKLIYPDGYLQEAGGILWKDGSAWNFGHRKDPEDPEYNYVKEVDYISGAAIMIRSSLWKEIGGFDPLFAPAYYEDTDLAFEVRRRGYKVIYQPKSAVVHFEGVSNGTDTGSGLKNYQVVNEKKFLKKWEGVLRKEHFENGKDVYLAKDRGQTRKQILVVDHYVPNFDKDAGGRCTFMYIKVFLDLGFKVTFIGDNFAKPEPYTSVLTQMGVEVLYGNDYFNNWQEWLKGNLKYFDYIYLQRPHISIKYIDLVKEYGRGKVFYFAHDLHHIRLYRDYQVTGNRESLIESEKWKKIEIELFRKADVGHVVGSFEQNVMQNIFPNKPIRNIPLYIYDEMPEAIEKDFSRRKDLLFVGGFNHHPNVDAVLWFAQEIYPRILKKYPDMVWHIVGSNAPEQIRQLQGENIVLEGFLSDEELEEMYRKCRLVVVPLRYGAGVKGKIVEAAFYQIPVVTTSIGGEGIDESVGSFKMEDKPDEMADLVIRLYSDLEELRKMSDAGLTLIQSCYTSQAAKRVLVQDMDDLKV